VSSVEASSKLDHSKQKKQSDAAALSAATEDELLLIQRICEGDKQGFYQLVRPYERSIYRAAFSILRNEQDAEDVAQEAVLKALTHLKSFRRESKFSTWLIQITMNEARIRLRKDHRYLYDSLDEGMNSQEGDYIPRDFADWREIPSEQLEQQRLRDALQKAIAGLAPKYQEVFIMRDVENESIEDTAKALGITKASVKTRLLRARLQMRDALAPGFDGGWTSKDGNWKKVRPW
jgi:RNA polymerase sigma-70 factor (ECF subfamily)